MTILDRWERRFGRWAVPRVTEALICCQVLLYAAQFTQPQILQTVALVPRNVLEGEVWRLVSFLLEPPLSNPLFAFFFWYLFYLMGTALEATWGAFRYNVYLLLGYVATVAASFVTPDAPASAGFLQGSVFLAFAFLYPDFALYLFFLLPVKIKWLALLTWIGYFGVLVFGDQWSYKLLVGASIVNFLVFFGRDIWLRIRSGGRRMAQQATRIKGRDQPRHTCRVCGVNNVAHPEIVFRYCSKCEGAPCYCWEHLQTHEHLASAERPADDPGAPSAVSPET